ncbi:hypothetical protein CORC01_07472 [Colletotrichum orchidophilum]|uniref:Metallo-beta-lactamase domain-containing protein n=1 Tax=Colletotrichum orchidophilum TaxID=1209926 RepID=A0A1G4B6Y4_9PEZI|nr:uncharacterized protein CORC01_07472 [Colletotrichum orchidophilum]OHE97218.1 hypothetical protein CORC01_07472 [Colletotrichum orchidophilum]
MIKVWIDIIITFPCCSAQHYLYSVQAPAVGRANLIAALASAKQPPKRSIVTLANCDNAWLVSIPKPPGTTGNKAFYHILQDPWLGGINDVFTAYLLRMQLKEKSALDGIEASLKEDTEHCLDAVVVTHTNPDHLRAETLRTIDPSMRVFTVEDAAATISAMKHFDSVADLPDFARDQAWPVTPEMPGWLSVFRLQDETKKYPHLYRAIVIKSAVSNDKNEVILYSPHGVDPGIVDAAMEMNPDASVLAMTRPLNETGAGIKSKGVANALKIERKQGPKYWIHCQECIQHSVLNWFMAFGDATLEQGLKEEARDAEEDLPKPSCVTILNGGGLILALKGLSPIKHIPWIYAIRHN